MTQHDYIVEVIEHFARLIGQLVGLRQEQRFDETEQAIGDALNQAFGPLRSTLDEVAASDVPVLVNNPEKVRLYCALLRESAQVAAAKGDARRARKLASRADAVEGGAGAEL